MDIADPNKVEIGVGRFGVTVMQHTTRVVALHLFIYLGLIIGKVGE